MGETPVLDGRRVLVIGASSGIGAAVARAVVAAGGDVTVSARRAERLDALVAELGRGHAAPGDACEPDEARRVAATAAEAMGGLDLMVYVAGYGVLQPLVDTDPAVWSDIYRVNVIGANLAAAAALDHLDRDGICAFVSSRTVEDASAIFASYSASKAALDQCIRTWRVEHPDRRFVRIVMGNCSPTEFAESMNLDLVGDALERWGAQALPGGMMHVDDVGVALARALAVALDPPGHRQLRDQARRPDGPDQPPNSVGYIAVVASEMIPTASRRGTEAMNSSPSSASHSVPSPSASSAPATTVRGSTGGAIIALWSTGWERNIGVAMLGAITAWVTTPVSRTSQPTASARLRTNAFVAL